MVIQTHPKSKALFGFSWIVAKFLLGPSAAGFPPTMMTERNLIFVFSAIAAALLVILLLPFFKFNHHHPTRGFLKWSNSRVYADLVVTNATIYTSDLSLPFAEAMAVRNGRILRVGDYDSIKAVIFLLHMPYNSKFKSSREGCGAGVHRFPCALSIWWLADKFPGEWIVGGGWNSDSWGGDLPIASWMDEINPDKPVWLSRMDGHMGVANSFALKVAGISNITKDPVGGTILKTADWEPTGLVVDSAMKLVFGPIPDVSISERRDALIRVSKYALTKGVTTVIDVGRYFPGA